MRSWFRAGARSWLAISGVLACVLTTASAQVLPDGAVILRRIDARYNHLSSLRCDFVETFSGLGTERQESGTLLLAKPGRMRWAYTEPAGKLFVLDGRYAWSYTPGDAQVQRVSAKQLDDLRSPLRFLLGRTRLERELTQITVIPHGSGYEIAGVPKGMEERVSRLTLDIAATGLIEEIRAEQGEGAVTRFRFLHSSENVPVSPQAFQFDVPAGVPVVDGLPPI